MTLAGDPEFSKAQSCHRTPTHSSTHSLIHSATHSGGLQLEAEVAEAGRTGSCLSRLTVSWQRQTSSC